MYVMLANMICILGEAADKEEGIWGHMTLYRTRLGPKQSKKYKVREDLIWH